MIGYADVHESYITERGSVIVTIYNITRADLTAVHGPKDGWIYDTLFYDVDIKSNKTLFRWSAYEAGIPISDAKCLLADQAPMDGFPARSLENPYDWFHMNAVQSVGNGYLVNGRHVWISYMLNSAGDIEWKIQVIRRLLGYWL